MCITVYFKIKGDEKLSWWSIWMVYLGGPATFLQSNVIFVPGAKRASTARLMRDGAPRPGVGEAGGVGEEGGVGEAGGVGEGGGAPEVTVRLADAVVSKKAVMMTDVLFPIAHVA